MRPKPQSPRSASDVAGIADPGEGMRPAGRGQRPRDNKIKSDDPIVIAISAGS